jgi:DNA-binding LytR/AlgR family response regulator
MPARPTALIADDEPLLREALARQLERAWPELDVVAQVRNGREAIRQYEALHPDVCFLDVHMPGLSGIEAAHRIGRRAHLVFVTAYDQYAVQAFAQGALDYLVKPVEASRLDDTVARLKDRLRAAQPAPDIEPLLQQLAARLTGLQSGAPQAPLRWIHAQVGKTLRLIPVEEIDYLRSDAKYTLVAWRDRAGEIGEALVRTPLKELVAQLDPAQFAQVHRSVVVNLRAISHVTRDDETATIHLKDRKEVLPVSRSYLHRFRQM